jgi:alkanesulfonate monooxygenase SsuD/methylene tetrahydromethanopterin reductase-like flavin-dependent oxidoreductase (luciferase family)
VKLGIILPTFRNSLDDALVVAELASEASLDGVFAYDHLYPMGSPERPSFAPFPVLAAIGARFDRLAVGPLVARIGLGDVSHVVNEFETLAHVSNGRAIVALGIGDAKSKDENRSYGLAYEDVSVRRTQLDEALRRLVGVGEQWVGGASEDTMAIARRHGATVNLWQATIDEVRAQSLKGHVNWAGDLGENPGERLTQLAKAGATWAIGVPSTSITALNEWRLSR